MVVFVFKVGAKRDKSIRLRMPTEGRVVNSELKVIFELIDGLVVYINPESSWVGKANKVK
jgi:hypothetical protein